MGRRCLRAYAAHLGHWSISSNRAPRCPQPRNQAPDGTPGLFLGNYVHPGGHFRWEYLCISLADLAAAQHAPDGRPLHPRVHRVKEVFLAKGDITFPAQEALQRQTRQLNIPADTRPIPVPIDALAGGGNAPAGTVEGAVEKPEIAGTIIYPGKNLPTPEFTPEGAEIKVDSPPAVTPLAAES